MGLTARLSVANRNAQLAAFGARLNNGYLRVYTGTQSATPESGIGGSTLLAELRFSATAFAAPANGIITANAITEGDAVTTGTAAWFEALQSDGTTVELTGSVGTSDSNCVLGSVAIQEGATVFVDGFIHTCPMQQVVCS